MQQLIRLDEYKPNAEYATVLAERYFRKNGDYPYGYGKWIFTNPDCQPIEVTGYYSTAYCKAKIYFKKLGYRFCSVSPESTKLKSPNRKPKWKKPTTK